MIGIIAEFNPLHNGHQHLINTAKNLDECLVIAMSGNIVQRGLFASIDKHLRAKYSIISGASLVLEIPPIFVLSSAEYYAKGAIQTLHAAGVNQIIFGSEIGDIKKLDNTLDLIQTTKFQNSIKNLIKLGNSYSSALLKAFKNENLPLDIIAPNNILALEYIKQCRIFNIKYQTIKRENNYNNIDMNYSYPSATAIRKIAQMRDYKNLEKFVPKHAVFNESDFLYNDDLYAILREKILNTGDILLHNIYDANDGIENRILSFAEKATSLEELISLSTTKRYTRQKIQRFLLHILLKITKEDAQFMLNNIDYYNVLGVKQTSVDLLSNNRFCTKYKDFISKNLLSSKQFLLQNNIDKIHAIINKREFYFHNMIIK